MSAAAPVPPAHTATEVARYLAACDAERARLQAALDAARIRLAVAAGGQRPSDMRARAELVAMAEVVIADVERLVAEHELAVEEARADAQREATMILDVARRRADELPAESAPEARA